MNTVIDFEAFSAQIGDDRAVESRLLHLFMETADAVMNTLETKLHARSLSNEEWAQQTHLLRGAALNVTAKKLAHLMSEARALESASHTAKQEFFLVMQHHYQHVRHLICEYIARP